MSEETRTIQTADTTPARAPEDAPALVKKIGKTTYKAVSYTHLWQGCCSGCGDGRWHSFCTKVRMPGFIWKRWLLPCR